MQTNTFERLGMVLVDGRVMTRAEAAGRPASTGTARAAGIRSTSRPTMGARSTGRPRNRVQIVADAVERDPACKGKAALGLALLANDELASVPGRGLVKMLRQMKASEATEMLKGVAVSVARDKAAQASALWDRAIAANAKGAAR